MIAIRPSTAGDLPAIVRLVNAAYRELGGWTTEHGVVFGDRIAQADLAADLASADKTILSAVEDGAVIGCVRLETRKNTLLVGLLAVRPDLQARGAGRTLLTGAEAYGLAHGATVAELSVVSIRSELIAWYVRRGYRVTTETAPFVYDQLPPGVAQTPGLEFAILRKRLG
ncbi:GNAT family N-acetyltransferase [Phenylobacterium immobile]|uniref:GNAT family N-acetyltransferase n=1 Tax=Phenylobacterium immobile TaxID=21 RepID=UPI000AABED8C|nr:GNAT family N-acetyltransferase [Phenylobacterium immobile]